ncbi:sulfotransferase domain-containing protein [Aestuariirhabdus sp. LZHN29]|uniref:sulfotransferase domain-containing protein n=1 Tax=Aestuariirhabdus sp. LZHN29 TaxID=3417462 RepID=UPI003CFBB98C
MSPRITDYARDRAIGLIKSGYRKLRREPAERVILVAGVQRSGTNMVMDIFDRCIDTDVYHETDERAFDNYQMLPIDRIQGLVLSSRSRCFIIKCLCELQSIDTLMGSFGNVRVVWVVRHYHDVVNSMLVSFRNQAEQVKRIIRYRVSDGWLSEGMSDETYNLLCETVGDKELDDASASALQWYFRNILFFEKNLENHEDVMLVRYEDLVRNPSMQMDRLYGFAGLDESYHFSKEIYSSSIGRKKPLDIQSDVEILCQALYNKFETYFSPSK